jgi:hypothetical protein
VFCSTSSAVSVGHLLIGWNGFALVAWQVRPVKCQVVYEKETQIRKWRCFALSSTDSASRATRLKALKASTDTGRPTRSSAP